MNIDNLTIGELKQLKNIIGCDDKKSFPFEVGKNYFIRTVSMYYTGCLKKIVGEFLVLSNAAWVADTGRFHDFLKTGSVNEVEPFIDDVFVPLGSICDATLWNHKLFEIQK